MWSSWIQSTRFYKNCKAYNIKTMELTDNSKSEEVINDFLNYITAQLFWT